MENNLQKIAVIVSMVLSFSSCINKENAVPLLPPGDESIAYVEMGELYPWQIYYSLKNNTEVSKNLYTDWDLGFETTNEGNHIKLNSAKFKMEAYPITSKDFSSITIADTIGVNSKIDMPSGSLDSTAIGNWNPGDIFILNRGTDEQGKNLGMCKIQFISVNTTKYVVRFSNMDGSGDKTMDIEKDNRFNFCFLSFNDGGKIVNIEPFKTDWDIVFTKYTHYYSDLDIRYSTVGCLLNSYKTFAVEDTVSKTFKEINLSKVTNLKFSEFISAIGFDWKEFNLTLNKFSVDPNRFYIIRGQQDIYYKLHFIDFYLNGVKGAPKWEYQRL